MAATLTRCAAFFLPFTNEFEGHKTLILKIKHIKTFSKVAFNLQSHRVNRGTWEVRKIAFSN
ncbi:MAG: hypothetical protein D6714_19770 [Bacteroidetes bacterium]|nr:MAG: hypothetical protein D6714_19770 [Bacteroidota bacterium]